ncbi:transposase [Candidatus Megaera polyxenophila]|jgi:transposase|nr:transposase [Candidatus Megaera polyxenophila]
MKNVHILFEKSKRLIFIGKAGLRKVLYMAAVASLRCKPQLKGFYDRLIANHKPPKVALVAVMLKLLKFMHITESVCLAHNKD